MLPSEGALISDYQDQGQLECFWMETEGGIFRSFSKKIDILKGQGSLEKKRSLLKIRHFDVFKQQLGL